MVKKHDMMNEEHDATKEYLSGREGKTGKDSKRQQKIYKCGVLDKKYTVRQEILALWLIICIFATMTKYDIKCYT